MPRPFHVVALTTCLLLIGGCCRDTIREMASLKDGVEPPHHQRSAKAVSEPDTKSAAVDDEDKGEIETGSVAKPNCQGQHLAYQATKEYLKNFGPRPPDQPGEQGPCNPDAH